MNVCVAISIFRRCFATLGLEPTSRAPYEFNYLPLASIKCQNKSVQTVSIFPSLQHTFTSDVINHKQINEISIKTILEQGLPKVDVAKLWLYLQVEVTKLYKEIFWHVDKIVGTLLLRKELITIIIRKSEIGFELEPEPLWIKQRWIVPCDTDVKGPLRICLLICEQFPLWPHLGRLFSQVLTSKQHCDFK